MWPIRNPTPRPPTTLPRATPATSGRPAPSPPPRPTGGPAVRGSTPDEASAAPACRRAPTRCGRPCRPYRGVTRPSLTSQTAAPAGTCVSSGTEIRTCPRSPRPAGRPPPPLRVESGERVVEDQDRRLTDLGLGGAPDAEPQAQRRRPGLAVRSEPAGGHLTHPQPQLVAMRPDQGGPSNQLVLPSLERAGGAWPPRSPRPRSPAPTARTRPGAAPPRPPRTRRRPGARPGRRSTPGRGDPRAMRSELGVPRVELRRQALALLEQPVPLAQCPVVRGPGGLLGRPHRLRPPRPCNRRRASGSPWIDGQVLRDEHHRRGPADGGLASAGRRCG